MAYAPGSLNFGTTYYWKVDEVNTVTYPGDVWSFTTQEYAAVDDFESYNDDDKRIYDAWIDGYTDGNSGSIVGYMARPVCRADDHSRRQAVHAVRVQQRQDALLLRGLADLRGDPELDDQRRRHPVAVLPRPGRGLRGQRQQRLHHQRQRRRYLGHRRPVPLCLQAAQRQRLDHHEGGQHRQHQRLGQGGSHDPRDPRRRLQECL